MGGLRRPKAIRNRGPPYDPRDYRDYPKCAAYLWGDDPLLLPQRGKRTFFDPHDSTGQLAWDPQDQCGIHIRSAFGSGLQSHRNQIPPLPAKPGNRF